MITIIDDNDNNNNSNNNNSDYINISSNSNSNNNNNNNNNNNRQEPSVIKTFTIFWANALLEAIIDGFLFFEFI